MPSRADQRGRRPASPSYFFKPASSVGASGGTVERPAGTELLAFEGEIALVIGTAARRVSLDEAWAHVGWVTASNDLGLYDLARERQGLQRPLQGRRRLHAARSRPDRCPHRRPCGPPGARLGERRAPPGRHHRRAHLPARAARRRPLPALHPRTGRRDPHRNPRGLIGHRPRRRRRDRGGPPRMPPAPPRPDASSPP